MTNELDNNGNFLAPEPPKRRGIDVCAEHLGLASGDEFARKVRFAGWDRERLRAELAVPGAAGRFAEAVEAGLAADVDRRLTGLMASLLAVGPKALAELSCDALAALTSDTRLKGITRDYDPFTHGGRLVCGPTGTGKSVAGIGALRRAVNLKPFDLSEPESDLFYGSGRQPRGREFAWVRAFDLPNARLAHALGQGEAELVKRASTVDFLVLDDLGWESKRAGADDVVSEVIASRYDAGLITYATTGLRFEQFEDRYSSAVVRRLTEAGIKGKVIDLWPKESKH